jgi:hypothetical protein
MLEPILQCLPLLKNIHIVSLDSSTVHWILLFCCFEYLRINEAVFVDERRLIPEKNVFRDDECGI